MVTTLLASPLCVVQFGTFVYLRCVQLNPWAVGVGLSTQEQGWTSGFEGSGAAAAGQGGANELRRKRHWREETAFRVPIGSNVGSGHGVFTLELRQLRPQAVSCSGLVSWACHLCSHTGPPTQRDPLLVTHCCHSLEIFVI